MPPVADAVAGAGCSIMTGPFRESEPQTRHDDVGVGADDGAVRGVDRAPARGDASLGAVGRKVARGQGPHGVAGLRLDLALRRSGRSGVGRSGAATARSGRGSPASGEWWTCGPAAYDGWASPPTRATPQAARTTRRTPGGTPRAPRPPPRSTSTTTAVVATHIQSAHPRRASAETSVRATSSGVRRSAVDGEVDVGERGAGGHGDQRRARRWRPSRRPGSGSGLRGSRAAPRNTSFDCVCFSQCLLRRFGKTHGSLRPPGLWRSAGPGRACRRQLLATPRGPRTVSERGRGRVSTWSGTRACSPSSTTWRAAPRRSTTPSARPTWSTAAVPSTPPSRWRAG